MSLKEAIKNAAKGLDHAKDDDWQEDGRPSLKRIHQLAKSTAITQDQLDDALPDLRRNRPVNNPGASTPTPEAAKTKAVAPAPGKLAPATSGPTATDVEGIKEASGVDAKGRDVKKKSDEPEPDPDFVENTLVVVNDNGPGYYGSKLRYIGETFYYTGRLGSWMDKADKEDRKRYAEERAADA